MITIILELIAVACLIWGNSKERTTAIIFLLLQMIG